MNPDWTAFLAVLGPEIVLGQVVIRRAGGGFELRHAADRAASADSLPLLPPRDLRSLAQWSAAGAFRPLKSAPNLRRGWRALAPDQPALELCVNHLYPGAVADWFAARAEAPPVTSYRQFTARQSGMYRISTLLDDNIAGAAIRACCHPDFCLKRRLWTVQGLAPDSPAQKSIIPCLEPCAIMLEFARKAARWQQEEEKAPPRAGLAPAADPGAAETDFDVPGNPRRVRFVLERQRGADIVRE